MGCVLLEQTHDKVVPQCRVYFSGPTFLVLAEISLDPPLLKYTLPRCLDNTASVISNGHFLFLLSSKAGIFKATAIQKYSGLND